MAMLLGLFLILIIVVLGIPYALEIEYRRGVDSEDLFQVKFWMGFFAIPLKVTAAQWVEEQFFGEYRSVFRGWEKSETRVTVDLPDKGIIRRVLAAIISPVTKTFFSLLRMFPDFLDEVKLFTLSLKLSTGDAALTAMASGALWGVIGMVMGTIQEKYHFLKAPEISIVPSFGQPELKIGLRCIFRIRLGYIIIKGLKTWFAYLRSLYEQRRVKI